MFAVMPPSDLPQQLQQQQQQQQQQHQQQKQFFSSPNLLPSNNHLSTASPSSSSAGCSGSAFPRTPFKPSVSSPLTSSPIRSSPPQPLSSLSTNTQAGWVRGSQSSPITSSSSSSKTAGFGTNTLLFSKLSAFSSRPARPNPVVRKREERRETRRKLFLQDVKARGEQKRWERRGGDDGILKLDFLTTTRNWKASKERDLLGVILDEDIEDLSQLQAEQEHELSPPDMDMADEILEQEEAEIEQLVSSFSQPSQSQTSQSSLYPTHELTHQHSDSDFGGDEYDDIFMDFIQHEGNHSGMDMDMS